MLQISCVVPLLVSCDMASNEWPTTYKKDLWKIDKGSKQLPKVPRPLPLSVSGSDGISVKYENPDEFYKPYSQQYLAGVVTVANLKEGANNRVAIRRTSISRPPYVKQFSHGNIVSLLELYHYQGFFYSVYECLDFTLADIVCAPAQLGEEYAACIVKAACRQSGLHNHSLTM